MSIFNTLVDTIEEQEIPSLDSNFLLQLEESGISLYDLNRMDDVDSVTEAFFEDPEVIKNFKENKANIKNLKNQWKKACNSFVESKTISRYIDNKQKDMVEKYYKIVCDSEANYGEYKKGFNFFCKFMGIPNKGVVIEDIKLKKDKKDADQKVIELRYSKGLVKVNLFTDDITKIEEFDKVIIEKNKKQQEYEIEEVKYQKNQALIKFKGIDNIDEAEKLRNSYIKIHRDDEPELPEDTYYIVDLIGLEVFSDDERKLGILKDVYPIPSGEHDIYVVDTGDKELLLPAIGEVIMNIDIANKKMIVHLLPGLE